MSDVIPEGFQMPDEEALNGEEMPEDDSTALEETESFVTDFMDAEEDGDEAQAIVEDAALEKTGTDEALEENEDEDADTVSVFPIRARLSVQSSRKRSLTAETLRRP